MPSRAHLDYTYARVVMTRSTKLPVLDRRAIHVFALTLFSVIVVQRAWVCDDAFISLRVVDNFTRGLGFVYNPGERVQGFTNPLWVLLLSGPYAMFREGFWTAIVVSSIVSITTASLIVFGLARGRMVGAVAVVALAFTQAFGDFSTGGLENPLGHLLIVAFLWLYLAPSSRRHNPTV